MQALATCRFVEHGENVVLLGPPGVGKTHLAVGLGLKAIEHGYRVLFTTAAAMLTTLSRAHADGRLDDKLKVFTVPRVLIIDEIGYLPIGSLSAKDSNSRGGWRRFLLSAREMRRATMLDSLRIGVARWFSQERTTTPDPWSMSSSLP